MEIKEKHAYKFKFYVGEEVIDAQFCSNEWNELWQSLNNGQQRIELKDGEPIFKTRECKKVDFDYEMGEWQEVKFDKWELLEDAEYNTRPQFSHHYYPSTSGKASIKNGF